MPGTLLALEHARHQDRSVSFGLHINLCEGTPLTHCPSLTREDGAFVDKRKLFLRSVSGQLDRDDVTREVAAQAAVLRDAGVPISHFDGHKHLHQLPTVCAAVADVARQFGVQRVRRSSVRRLHGLDRTSTAVRELLANGAGRRFRAAGLRFPDRVVDLGRIMQTDAARAAAMLAGDTIVEVFCHPGTAAAEFEKPGSCGRHAELQYLLSDQWAAIVRASGRQPVTYWQV
jgi:predicted glycoside hydrolase/deacetylase ChbG (UPF0249 family)